MPRIVITLLILLLTAPAALAEVKLPSVFGDHMVLQRDKEFRVWGKAEPGEEVVVTFAGAQSKTKADKNGDWRVMLKARPASAEGQTLTIQGKNKIEIKDVLVGEVWVASGQSNMQWTVAQSANAQEEIANSANDQIRMWTATRTVKAEPAFDVAGGWAVASPKTTGGFSAVAYYYARQLQEELGVPVGILHTSWGGTPVEAWTSRDKLNKIDWAKPILQRYDAAVKVFPRAKAQFDKDMKRWEKTRNGPGNTGHKAGYAKPDFDDRAWKTMKLPQTWEKAGLDKDGVVWFRRTVDIPNEWKGQQLKLELGPIDDGDTVYINNKQVGHTDAFIRAWQRPRVYGITGDISKAGRLTIAIRVIDTGGDGGVWGKPEQLKLSRNDGEGEPIALHGDWKYLLAHEINERNRPVARPSQPFGPDHPHAPGGLFNGMVAPIVPYTIRGTIWYQGESNASRAEQYEKLFPGMIADWRERWGQDDFPFLFVQLANYRQPTNQVVDTDWAHLRDAQFKTLREVKNTGMAVIIDIGEANDIHPRNKQDVGKRLARWALCDTYAKKDVVKSGPIFKDSWHDKQNKALAMIQFDTFGSGLKVRGGGPLRGFLIADGKKNFIKANAEIVNNEEGKPTVIKVWSDKIPHPTAVRYAWEDNPDEANLVNEEGLPAGPFRTDDWKGPTDGRR